MIFNLSCCIIYKKRFIYIYIYNFSAAIKTTILYPHFWCYPRLFTNFTIQCNCCFLLAPSSFLLSRCNTQHTTYTMVLLVPKSHIVFSKKYLWFRLQGNPRNEGHYHRNLYLDAPFLWIYYDLLRRWHIFRD